MYQNRYLDSTNHVISDFNEDADVTTTTVAGGHIHGDNLTVWREGRIPFRRGDRDYNGVFIGWNRQQAKGSKSPPTPVYAIDLPPQLSQDWNVNAQSELTFSIAVTDEKAPPPGKKPSDKPAKKEEKPKPELTDFSIAAQSTDSVTVVLPLSRFGTLLPPSKVKFTKLDWLDRDRYVKASEPVFQSIAIPLAAFAAQDPRFNPAKLKVIRLQFDRTPERVILVSEIGLAQQM